MAKNENGAVNPFSVKTPEDLTAEETIRLFVDVFTDFFKIRDPGHAMLNGARGTGKSMMFRFLQPDCQRLDRGCCLAELPYLSVLVSVKNTNPNITELQRLVDSHAAVLLNEHFLTMFVASQLFDTLACNIEETSDGVRASIASFYEDAFLRLLRRSGFHGSLPEVPSGSPEEYFKAMMGVCESLYCEVLTYLKRMSFDSTVHPYGGALCDFLDFLVPLTSRLRELESMPNGPVYLLIDDADYLSEIQTRILNSWISTRTSASVSIKASTAFRYKTMFTLSRQRIDSPHDFSEVNISDIYTTSKGKYLRRVQAIVEKRLALAGIEASPREFFPEDEKQEAAIREIAADLRREWKRSGGRGYRPSDDALRYSRPQFIASLKGKAKSGSSYSYAGFEQIVHVSSGVVRFFLESAAVMFDEELAKRGPRIECIRPHIQNEVLRDQSKALMFDEFDKLFVGISDEEEGEALRKQDVKLRLHNLLRVLGGLFHQKLISDDAERRVFSVAFSDSPSEELKLLLRRGVEYGYFQKSSIGNKDGTGRTPLYVLTRRLAPYFFLDPTGFAGYLFVTSDKLEEGIRDPDAFLRAVKKVGVAEVFEEGQLRLFE